MAPLCWGQQWSWHEQHLPEHKRAQGLLLSHVMAMPAGATVANVRDAIQLAVSRHASLRSTVAVDGQGRPRQAEMSADLAMYEFEQFEDKATCLTWLRRQFAIESSWPFRAGVIHTPTRMYLGMAIHHIAADLEGFRILWVEIHKIVSAFIEGVPPSLQPVIGQPVDLATAEQSPAGMAQNKRAIAYWLRCDDQVGEVLDDLRRRGRPADAMHVASVYSGEVLPRLRALGGTSAGEGAVATAAISCVLSQYLGRTSVPLSVIVANRHLPGIGDTVCSVAQSGLFAIGVRDPRDLEGTIPAAWSGTLVAARYGHYDGDELFERMTSFDSGGRHATAAPPSINISRTAIVTSDVADHQRLHDERRAFTTWVGQVDRPRMGLSFLARISDSCLCIELRVGTHLVSQDDCVALAVGAMQLIHG